MKTLSEARHPIFKVSWLLWLRHYPLPRMRAYSKLSKVCVTYVPFKCIPFHLARFLLYQSTYDVKRKKQKTENNGTPKEIQCVPLHAERPDISWTWNLMQDEKKKGRKRAEKPLKVKIQSNLHIMVNLGKWPGDRYIQVSFKLYWKLMNNVFMWKYPSIQLHFIDNNN